MPKLAAELNDLPVESVDVLPADTLEALETGHGMTEIAASCPASIGNLVSCAFSLRPDDDDVLA